MGRKEAVSKKIGLPHSVIFRPSLKNPKMRSPVGAKKISQTGLVPGKCVCAAEFSGTGGSLIRRAPAYRLCFSARSQRERIQGKWASGRRVPGPFSGAFPGRTRPLGRRERIQGKWASGRQVPGPFSGAFSGSDPTPFGTPDDGERFKENGPADHRFRGLFRVPFSGRTPSLFRDRTRRRIQGKWPNGPLGSIGSDACGRWQRRQEEKQWIKPAEASNRKIAGRRRQRWAG